MPNITEVHNLLDAVRAQAEFVSEATGYIAEHGYTDDDTDYLPGALDLLKALQMDHYASLSLTPGTVMRDTGTPSSAEAAPLSRLTYQEYQHGGDMAPRTVLDFLGVGKED